MPAARRTHLDDGRGETRPGRRARAAPRLSAAAALWGGLAGIGGLVHGVGEIVQGDVPAPGPFVASWTSGPIADNLGGEPGLTLVPNMLASGILTSVTAVALIVASVVLATRHRGGWVLVGLSVALLLVGGGVGPPIIGLCAGAAALAGRRRSASTGTRSEPGAATVGAYRWLFGLSLALVAFLVLGSLFVALVLDVDVSNAFVYAFFASVVVLPVTVAVGARVPDATAAARPSVRPTPPTFSRGASS